jgi:hypothetical protein
MEAACIPDQCQYLENSLLKMKICWFTSNDWMKKNRIIRVFDYKNTGKSGIWEKQLSVVKVKSGLVSSVFAGRMSRAQDTFTLLRGRVGCTICRRSSGVAFLGFYRFDQVFFGSAAGGT